MGIRRSEQGLAVLLYGAMGKIGKLRQAIGRSLIPLLALVIVIGTVWWGPWITLAAAAVLWLTIGHLI